MDIKILDASRIKWKCVHHSGGTLYDRYAKTQHLKAEQVNKYHKDKWNFKSSLGFYGGYNFFIDKEGIITQFRAIGEETAAQKGHNSDSVSYCLAGNFNIKGVNGIEQPNRKQIESLAFLLEQEPHIQQSSIVPHWVLQPTECYGASLSADWARSLLKKDSKNYRIFLLTTIRNLLQKLVALMLAKSKLGAIKRDCHFTDVRN